MRPESQAFGQAAETSAARYLRRKGFRILERNRRSVIGEVDLIAQAGDVLVFIEVKARRTTRYGGAAFAVDRRKQTRLIRLAAEYLASHRIHDRTCRFDVMLYDGDPTAAPVFDHIENAFEVPGEDLRW